MTLETPVINQTGLTNRFDFKLHWNEYANNANGRQSDYPNPDQLKRALTDQLGLELVPGTASIEMLVVERAP